MMAIRPTLKYTSLGNTRSHMASAAPSTPSGTTSSTANGIDQLSYSAARHRNTTRIEIPNSIGAWLPETRSSNEVLDHSKPMPAGSLAAMFSMASIASPELRPGAGLPEILIEAKPL